MISLLPSIYSQYQSDRTTWNKSLQEATKNQKKKTNYKKCDNDNHIQIHVEANQSKGKQQQGINQNKQREFCTDLVIRDSLRNRVLMQ